MTIPNQFNCVDIRGRKHDRYPSLHIHGLVQNEGITCSICSGFTAVEDIALYTGDACNHGPGGVIMRRLCFARQTRRHIEGIAPTQILTETIHLRRVVSRYRKVFRRKKFALQTQLLQSLRYGLECFGERLPRDLEAGGAL